MEAREHGAELKAAMFVNEFAKKFRSIDYSIHPSDIPGEVAGKGSNAAWAARKISEKYSIGQRKDVIVTGIDGTWSAAAFVGRRSRKPRSQHCVPRFMHVMIR